MALQMDTQAQEDPANWLALLLCLHTYLLHSMVSDEHTMWSKSWSYNTHAQVQLKLL
jgi:hypothetical protein